MRVCLIVCLLIVFHYILQCSCFIQMAVPVTSYEHMFCHFVVKMSDSPLKELPSSGQDVRCRTDITAHYYGEHACRSIAFVCLFLLFHTFLLECAARSGIPLMSSPAQWAFFLRQYALHSLIGIDFQRRGL